MDDEEIEKNIAEIVGLMKNSKPNRRFQRKFKGGLVSRRQAIGLSQTSDILRASYTEDFWATPVRDNEEGLTNEVGPGDYYNPPWSQQRSGRGLSGEA